MNNEYRKCINCGDDLVTAKTLGKLYCSHRCCQHWYRLKEQHSPHTTHPEWRAEVVARVLANKPHPNPAHKANQLLGLMRAKQAEAQEIADLKNNLFKGVA